MSQDVINEIEYEKTCVVEDCARQAALRVDADRMTDALQFGAIPAWDSLGHVNLMLALQGLCGAAIDDDRMVELTSVAAIRDFVAAHRKEPA